MFDSCQQEKNSGPRCSDVAEKLAQLFGWRQTYKVEKLQRTLSGNLHTRHASLIKVPLGAALPYQNGGSFKSTTKINVDKEKEAAMGNDSWVAVHNLRSQSGGGILDPDDRLNDVADDREQIIANFEDGDGVHHGGGDGASGSSVGTGSPDIFHGSDKYAPTYSRTDIEVTGEQIASGLNVPLQVRRGSEPALNQLIGCGPQTNGCGPPDTTRPPIMQDPSKRWSAAPIINDDHSIERNNHNNGYLTPEEEDSIEEDRFLRISRDGSNRLSMQFLDGGGYKWAEAAEKAANSLNSKNKTNGSSKSLPRDGSRRKEPLGQANTSSPTQAFEHFDSNSERIETIVIRNEPGQLGVHVVPDYDRMSKERGLLVQGIEPGGRIDRHGKLSMFDRIIEINGQPLQNIPFQRVQEIFKIAQTAPELVLKVIKKRSSSADPFSCKPPAPIYPRSDREDKENVSMVEVEEKFGSNTKLATVSPTKKVPPGSRNPKSLLTANTRRIGRKIELELLKGPHGLGFSITTRDNPAGGNCPIYIKNILPKGAAVEDGRLKPGDRLLEVNGIEMTGKSQAEAVTVLRNAPTGSCVRIVVSRQEDATIPGPNLPRDGGELSTDVSNNKSRAPSPCAPAIPPLPSTHELMNNKHSTERTGSVAKIISQFQEAANKSATSSPLDAKSTEDAVLPWKHREILTFNIPVHDSEKAGLGVSVKGKTTNQNGGQSSDLGIFVKNVLHGGAASRDKRLRTNDQLLNVNGISLLHQSNSDAMETLRRAMLHTEGPVPGSITLTIARRVPSPAPPNNNNNNINNNQNSSNHVSATSGRDSASSLLTHSSGPETFVGNSSNENESSSYLTDNSGASEKSGNTVIFLPYTKKSESSSANHSLNNSTHSNRSFGNMESWNHPVIDRITGQNTSGSGPHQLRNESYYMATHDHTWNGSFQNDPKLSSPTVNLPSGETILIENEYIPNYPPGTGYNNRNGKSKSNDNLLNNNTTDGKINVSITNCDQSSDSTPTNPTSTDVTYASQLSLENPAGFTRDAFGRQSMSEKRHATLDAKNTGTYQRTKKLREEREKSKDNEKQENGKLIRVGSVESIISLNRSPGHKDEEADKLGQLGPSLGMKKSSSLESLQTMVQGIQMDSDPAYSYRGNQGALRVIRGRGCDDSFRAAVDIDYKSVGKTNDAKKHWLLDPPIAAANSDLDAQDVGFMNTRGGPRQSSLNAADNKKAAKKKAGLLKGIGSMFRFGKHRKTLDVIPGLDDRIIMAHENTVHHEKQDSSSSQTAPSETNQQSSTHNGNESTSSTDQQHQQQQHHQQSSANGLELQRPNNPSHQPPPNVPPSHYRQLVHQQMNRMQTQNHTDINENPIHPAAASSRNQYVQELRSLHQKRHAERQGHYVSEEREDQYERAIRQRLEQVPDTIHGRSASYDVYGDVKRPGSRSAIGAGDPQRFSHYVNYDELQHHLSNHKDQLSEVQIVQMRLQVQHQRLKVEEESRRQQHYHSQRQPARESQQRPMSNFYEYESIQSLMNSQPRSLISSPHSTNHDIHNDTPPAHHITKSSSSSTSSSTTRITSNAIDKTTSITKQHFTQHARPYQPPPPISRGHEPTYGSRAMTNGNPRTYQRYVANHNQRNVHKLSGNRGPFITQVTIEDQTQKTAGSRV